ncbi:Sec23/Sec24 protein transport family protein [Actinidia rufa]|uniref:Protein transport protein SEC23 n=1 Tax=Actinidia rufa TaxID=165716 RepID=A0A7J0GSC8_9ERIC|nr:Sec23/Sec24 protein transport family protein [Actinidia rufa]
MANQQQPLVGYSVTVSQDDARPPPPPPFLSPTARFTHPPPMDQIPTSPSIKTPSPAAGSPAPHLSTPPGPPPPPLCPLPPLPSFQTGFQHQVSHATEQSVSLAESPYVLFSAHTILKQKKLANIPSLGFGVLVSPGREISPGPQIIQRDPHRCQNCGSYANLYCNILPGSGQWQCVLCRNLNGSEGEYIASSKEELCNLPELSSPLVDYVQTGSKRPGFTPVSDSRMSAPIVIWMENLGREAHQHNTVVDILCAGTCPVRVPVLQPLAKASGGVLILHDDFGEAFGVNLQRASTRAAGSHGLLEVRCSDDILITQVIADISRVITVRLPTADSVSAYLESVQDEIAAVLIAKRTLLQAKTFSKAMDMRAIIDERVKGIASKFGSQMPKSKLYQFPNELSLLPEFLFHLRRGPLLGSIVGHEDERSVLRNLFLNASFDLSLRMVAPRCLMHREGGTFEELPAHDLAVQSDAAVVLDHGTDVFIWLGAELAAEEGKSAAALAACRTLAEELTEMRFPAPRILAFKEGSSQARYFVSRLIPAHKDPPYEQEARFPQLKTLTTDQRAKLKSNFLHFDDPSFWEWMRSLKVLPPEPS